MRERVQFSSRHLLLSERLTAMTKYRVTLTRQVWQEATLYVDAADMGLAEADAFDMADDAIWHDQRAVKNTLEAQVERSEDVDKR